MTHRGKALIWLVVAALALPLAAMAQDEKGWSVDVAVDYSSIYLFRGVDLLDDEPVLVPNISFGIGGFTVWSYAYAGDIPGGDYRELDYGADYTFSLGSTVALSVGALQYTYNEDTEAILGFLDTTEVYGILAFDMFLSPTITYYEDIDEVEGGYAQIALSHGFDISESVNLTFSGAVGFDFGYNLTAGYAEELGLEESSGDLNDALFGADLAWQVTDAFGMHVLVQRSIALDVLDDIGQEDETVLTGGLYLSF